jgi:hypothetical protein
MARRNSVFSSYAQVQREEARAQAAQERAQADLWQEAERAHAAYLRARAVAEEKSCRQKTGRIPSPICPSQTVILVAEDTAGDGRQAANLPGAIQQATTPAGDGSDALGLVVGTVPATPLHFSVGLAPGQYVQLDDVVVTRRELPAEAGVQIAGVVTNVEAVHEGARFASDVFLIEQGALPAEVCEVAEVTVTRVEPEVYVPPLPGAPVRRAVGAQRESALYFDEMGASRVPVGFGRDGQVSRSPRRRRHPDSRLCSILSTFVKHFVALLGSACGVIDILSQTGCPGPSGDGGMNHVRRESDHLTARR